jgi:hypothetical protein
MYHSRGSYTVCDKCGELSIIKRRKNAYEPCSRRCINLTYDGTMEVGGWRSGGGMTDGQRVANSPE